MNGENKRNSRDNQSLKIRFMIWIGFLMIFFGINICWGNDWELFPWGLNLEELNQAVKQKDQNRQIKEDLVRSEIEFQYAPAKSFKIRRGKVVALLSLTNPSSPGRLYGYAFEGKIFGRVIFFKDNPEIFPETVARTLLKEYPQGKIFRTFGPTRTIPYFEYRSNQLFVFSTDRGIFYYDPSVLETVLKIELEQFKLQELKYEEENRAKGGKP
jgi:hypothetical protein